MAPNPPWADLPSELLSAIAQFLDSNAIDILHFRAVCKSWFSCLLPPNILSPQLPLIVPGPHPALSSRWLSGHDRFLLSSTAVYALRPPHGVQIDDSSSEPKTWVVFVDEVIPGKVHIREPFSKGTFHKPVVFPRKLNLLDFGASEIGRYYNVSRVYIDDNGKVSMPRSWSDDVQKVAFFSNGSAILVIFEKGKLGMLRLGIGNSVLGKEWQIIHDGKGLNFDDIINYKGRMLGIDRRGRVFEIDYYSPTMKIISSSIAGGGGKRKRLIESSGMLHLVARCNDRGTKEETGLFKVYILDETIGKWVETAGIGDRIFFFGHDFSFSTSTQEFEGPCRKNCIIFQKRSFEIYGKYGDPSLFDGSRCGSPYVGVYNVEDGGSFHLIESCPGYTNLLWPPPTWLWRNKKLKPLKVFESAFHRLFYRIQNADLKDNFIERFPLVAAMVSGEGFSQQDIPDILKETDMLTKFLGELVVDIETECKFVKKDIAKEAVSRRQQSESSNLLNQEGTSGLKLGAEHKNGCVDTVRKKATKPSKNEREWKKSELARRLCTHYEVMELFRSVISVIGEKNVKGDMEARNKLFSLLSADE